MGAWSPDPWSSDTAMDFAADLADELVTAITAQLDDGRDEAGLARIAMLCAVIEESGTRPEIEPGLIDRWTTALYAQAGRWQSAKQRQITIDELLARLEAGLEEPDPDGWRAIVNEEDLP